MTQIRKIGLVLFLTGLNLGFISAQNLVINPSFENTANGCSGFPIPVEGFSDLNDWDNANSNAPGDSCSSPDLFSTCNSGMTALLGVPSNALGWQNARTGNKYAGIINYSAPFGINDEYREYIQGHTTAPLTAGQTYCVSMYVSLANGSPWACNNMGIYFSNTHYLRDACAGSSPRINVTPQLNYSCAVINDTTAQWFRIQWDYVAAGGEQYFVIGNFFNDAATNKVSTGVSSLQNMFAYYYIDDVSIVPNSCCYADISPVGTLCITDPPVTLTAASPNSGTSCTTTPVTGTWSGPGVSAAGVFTPATAGPGTHTVTFTLSCGATVTRNITVSPCLAIAACVETNGNITASNGVAPYSWQNQTTTQDCSACFFGCTVPPNCAVNVTTWTTFTTGTSIPAPSTFPVRVMDNTGTTLIINSLASLPACTSSPCPTITVSVASQTPVGCGSTNNGTATVSASGGTAGYQYVWTPGNLIGASQNSLSAQTYTVNVVDANNCTGSTTVTITSSTALSLTTGATSATCGQNNGSASVTVNGGTGTYTYAWSPNGGTAATTPSTLAAGTYTVTVTGGGCTGTATATVTAAPAPVVNVVTINHPTCAGMNNGSFVYTIDGGAPTTSPATFGAGTITANVTDANGCVTPVTVTFVAPTITATVNTTGANCGATNGSATVTPTGGTGTYTYAWSPSGGTGAVASNLSSGAYSVLITDGNGCTLNQPVNVPAIGGPTLAMSNVTNATCGQNNGSATVTASGGSAPYTYAWSPSGGTGTTASGLSAGNYTVTVTDGSGCAVSETATIGGGSAVNVIGTVTDENCGQSNGQVATTVSGGTGPYTYAWTPGGSTSQNLTGAEGGLYAVTVTDAAGCSSTMTFTIDVIGALGVTVTPPTATIEQGDTVQLTASGGVTYTWTPAGGLSCTTCAAPMASPVSTTTYEVTGTDANGCSGTQEVTIFVNPVCSKEIFVPTIFSPNGDGQNDQQCVMGNCIVELNFSIYNRWGEKVFETNDQNKCWDATFKGKRVNSGVFVYKMTARLLNGSEINQSGNITVVE